ncbi:hypothetical protein BFJ66_g17014 [Fusarium oxysporum f. sp. cepae]|uniref:Uncharacterized protein n=1 Tax=Fusarium oxysporum f. sp. cepae TaxID=396571 RepID=A0A3L6N2F1_FUSOX|nr:hypothetical protein BFJ65_g14977 [Fusarium oxysporum f. sp. cepae]RKK23991.1 hypothetical protein BFJ67_g16859 [Fusarium oxysporum f. sp. cepae]RKK26684.1 hypothetical protein BFJ66_g17014 [Fusarium oxysporum f. sp. cepae]
MTAFITFLASVLADLPFFEIAFFGARSMTEVSKQLIWYSVSKCGIGKSGVTC